MEQVNNVCKYTYSAKEQEEVKRIYDKYISKDENKMEKLRQLDRSAERIGIIVATTVGIIGTLILGLGMCYFLTWSDFSVMGLLISIPGLVAVMVAYPLYKYITVKRRKQIAPEIEALCKELMV